MRMLLAATAALAMLLPAAAQDNHAQHHDVYKGWTNRNGSDCCHGRDCGTVRPEDIDYSGPAPRVRVRGAWCEVKDWMLLKTGRSPDWTTEHACVAKNVNGTCEALICFAGKPLY